MSITPKFSPCLDPDFVPAVLWNRAFQKDAENHCDSRKVCIAIQRPDKTCTVFETQLLPACAEYESRSLFYVERILKFLLWQRGGNEVWISGCDELTAQLALQYSSSGSRKFDYDFFGEKCYLSPLKIRACRPADLPMAHEQVVPLGRHLDGCRIGFDLGGSDRKCAAVQDGKVVFSEEVEWNPYFEQNPAYHIAGIQDSLERAAAHLPRVDAIGGSAAGVYVNKEVRVASLFRGVSDEDFQNSIRRIFFDLQSRWQNIPFEVVNDGEVTALAGSMRLEENAVLGLAMGTSQAAGYVTEEGTITAMLNELAFAPVDYRENAPADEWSGDLGCGVQYFSQQAVARLVPFAGIMLPETLSFPDQLIEVQKLMKDGDARASRIYATLGVYLGYTIAHYADFYKIRKILLLGRVTSGDGGKIMIEKAEEVLRGEFPELSKQIDIVTLSEKDKRHGQAVAAASLPAKGDEP
ncbi:ROK family protein [Kiritimatiellaeota bacterium B1221]|nr:ROK family protein [Kiritimatiellaeota bacterium B1221]